MTSEFFDQVAGDILPEPGGYLDDGTAMFRLEDVAAKMGLSPAEAERSIKAFLADREARGQSNADILTDPAMLHRKQ